MKSRVLHFMGLVNIVRLSDTIGQKGFKENSMSDEAFLSYEETVFHKTVSRCLGNIFNG